MGHEIGVGDKNYNQRVLISSLSYRRRVLDLQQMLPLNCYCRHLRIPNNCYAKSWILFFVDRWRREHRR